MSKKQERKQRRPAVIIRLCWRWGYHPGRVMREVLEWTEVLVVAGALAALIMTFVTVRMHVPTESMVPTIQMGDSFFVDRITYYFRSPQPGDIVVFRHTDAVYVKSVIEGSLADRAGVVPGERLLQLSSIPVYTTQFIEEKLAEWSDGVTLYLYTDSGAQYTLGARPDGASTLEDLGIVVREERMRYVKRLIAVGGQTVQIVDGDVYVNGERLEGDAFDRTYTSNNMSFNYGVEPTLVPEGTYFVLGDNSTNSFDSRYWGFVDESDFIGEPYLRVWPLNRFGLM